MAVPCQSFAPYRNPLRARRGCANHARATELLQLLHRIDNVRVKVMMRAKFFGERSFIFSAAERHGLESHFPRVLNPEMSESADALYRDHVTGARARIAQCIENRHARAHEWPGLFRWQFIGNRRQRRSRGDHVLGVTAIEIDAGHLAIGAHRKIAAPTLVADEIVSAMPADTDALSFRPIGHAVADKIDNSGN